MCVRMLLDTLSRYTSLWYIQPCCAITGDGLLEGLEWLEMAIAHKNDDDAILL